MNEWKHSHRNEQFLALQWLTISEMETAFLSALWRGWQPPASMPVLQNHTPQKIISAMVRSTRVKRCVMKVAHHIPQGKSKKPKPPPPQSPSPATSSPKVSEPDEPPSQTENTTAKVSILSYPSFIESALRQAISIKERNLSDQIAKVLTTTARGRFRILLHETGHGRVRRRHRQTTECSRFQRDVRAGVD